MKHACQVVFVCFGKRKKICILVIVMTEVGNVCSWGGHTQGGGGGKEGLILSIIFGYGVREIAQKLQENVL